MGIQEIGPSFLKMNIFIFSPEHNYYWNHLKIVHFESVTTRPEHNCTVSSMMYVITEGANFRGYSYCLEYLYSNV
jgi:hypothetical protein